MAFWDSLIGSGVKDAGDGVKTALDGAGGFLKDVRTAITGKDPELEGKILEAISKIDGAQNAITLAEAQSASFFVAGWRPAIGWVCALALFLYYPSRVLIGMILWVKMAWMSTGSALPVMPEVGMSDIIALVFSLLGMSGLRTIEKKADVAR